MQLPKISSNISPIWIALAGIWVGVVVVFGIIIFVSQDSAQEQLSSSPVPAATQLSAVEKAENWTEATIPISARGSSYVSYSDNPQEPQILETAFDPFDVQIGEEQVIIVRVREKGDTITRENTVTAEIMTDNGSELVPLKLKKVEDPDLSTTWQGAWIVDDTHEKIYSATITATSANGSNSTTLSFK